MKKIILISLSFILAFSLGACGSNTTSLDTRASGEDYTTQVFTAFWESVCDSFGVSYSDYEWAHTATSYISDSTTSDGYTAHYYLIKTAFETKNAFGQDVLHPITARCYYVPDYSQVVYVTYMTLDGETVLFNEETEDWLLGIGNSSSNLNANITNTSTTTTAPITIKTAFTTTRTTTKPTKAPVMTTESETLSTDYDYDADYNFEDSWKQQVLNAEWISEYELKELSGEPELGFYFMPYFVLKDGEEKAVWIARFSLTSEKNGTVKKEFFFVYDLPKDFSGTGKFSGIHFKQENEEWFFCPRDLVSIGLLNEDGSFNLDVVEEYFNPEKIQY